MEAEKSAFNVILKFKAGLGYLSPYSCGKGTPCKIAEDDRWWFLCKHSELSRFLEPLPTKNKWKERLNSTKLSSDFHIQRVGKGRRETGREGGKKEGRIAETFPSSASASFVAQS